MRIRVWLCAGLIFLSADVAVAQTAPASAASERGSGPAGSEGKWHAPYAVRDYPTAAGLLQAAVFEHSPQGGDRYPDVEAIQTLAEMYAEGRGVSRDALTACALSNLGSGAAVYRYGDRDSRTLAVQKQVEAYCVPLSAEERREAMGAGGCFQQGPASTVLFSTPAKRIEVSRSTLIVVDRGRTREYPLRPLLRCAQQVPLVRHVRVGAPKGSKAGAREFVQMLSWHSNIKDGVRMRTLEWSAVELTPQSAMLRARTVLIRGEGSTWPARPVPDEFAGGATFQMHKSGDVRWQMTGRSALHGVIGRPTTLRAASNTR
ncbi:MAG: hypothetical protein WBC51_07055 [Vicinamibacterales bacterium]